MDCYRMEVVLQRNFVISESGRQTSKQQCNTVSLGIYSTPVHHSTYTSPRPVTSVLHVSEANFIASHFTVHTVCLVH